MAHKGKLSDSLQELRHWVKLQFFQMFWIHLKKFRLIVYLCVYHSLGLNEARGLVGSCLKATAEASKLCLSYSSLKQLHFVLQKLHFQLRHVTLRSKTIQWLHKYWYHQLAKFSNIRSFLWVWSHTSFHSVYQDFAIMSLVYWFILTIYYFIGDRKWITCNKRLLKCHKFVNYTT